MTGTPRREVYIHSHHPVVVASHASRTAQEAAAFLLPRIKPNMSVIDRGCGPGSITIGLGKAVPEGRVVGVDVSIDIVTKARDRAGTLDSPNVSFEAASAYELPFTDDSFDAAYAHQLLQHLGEPVTALTEARRVLRPEV